ncbi:MAG: 16S rRNA (cytosine1407-C5)-methyltransferase [Planctomycetota bacterium]|jgi:16S rRNA (cytosine1407-C5)-methyltransferase
MLDTRACQHSRSPVDSKRMEIRIPEKFLAHIAPLIGNEMEQSEFRKAVLRPLPKTLRANLNKQSATDWHLMAKELGLVLAPLPFLLSNGYQLESGKDAGKLLEHRMGFFYLQEAASMIPVEVLSRLCPDARRILDLCAAPGSKTTQIATRFPKTTHIVANEPSASRLSVLVANLLRFGIGNVVCSNQDGCNFGAALPEYFDAILVDAPCSGEGTIRKDRQALRGWNRKRFKKITRVQEQLLESAFASTAPGGAIVYSTCALSSEENQDIALRFIENHADELEVYDLGQVIPELEKSITPEGFLWVAPHHYDTGGFFVASFRKAGQRSDAGNEVDGEAGESGNTELSKRLEDHYGVDLSEIGGSLVHRGSTTYLQPSAASSLNERIRLNRPGIKVAETKAGETHIHQEFGMVHGAAFKRGFIEVDRDEARHFLYGGVLDYDASALGDNQILMRYRGQPLGFAVWSKDRFTNLLGPSFVQQRVD